MKERKPKKRFLKFQTSNSSSLGFTSFFPTKFLMNFIQTVGDVHFCLWIFLFVVLQFQLWKVTSKTSSFLYTPKVIVFISCIVFFTNSVLFTCFLDFWTKRATIVFKGEFILAFYFVFASDKFGRLHRRPFQA